MIPTSTVPAVKQYLFEQLKATLSGDGTTTFGVFYGPPGQNQPGDVVSIGDVSDRQVVPWMMVGDGETGAFRETYHVTVVIDCYHGDADPQTLETRSLSLAAAVETFVRTDMTLGGLVLKAEPSQSSSSLAWTDNYGGLVSRIDVQIAVLAPL